MDRIDVSVADLLAALATVGSQPANGPDGTLTMVEWADALSLDERSTRKKLGALHRAGRLECFRVNRVGMDGRRTNVPAYRLKDA